MSKILITGGAGYIGSHTAVELLNNGEEIVIVDNFINSSKDVLDKIKKITNKDFKFYEVDLLDEILNNRPISIKRNMKDPIVVSKSTNLASCLEILEAARAHMAVVTDKENKFLGIITMEDIIAELMKS